MFTTRRKLDPLTFSLRGVEVGLSQTLKYLGIWYDGKMSFREHMRKVAEKANRIVGRLSFLMRNVGGPREAKRRLLMNTPISVMMYGAPVSYTHLTLPTIYSV